MGKFPTSSKTISSQGRALLSVSSQLISYSFNVYIFTSGTTIIIVVSDVNIYTFILSHNGMSSVKLLSQFPQHNLSHTST